MTRKKKGSSLILVMMISAIFLVISAVVTTAVMTTTRANAAEQRYEDLLYGAESGIESAFARIHRGEYSNSAQNEIISYTMDKDSSGMSIFNDYIVDISINETNGNTYNVKSRAVSRNNPNSKREVSARVTKPVTASTNIFKYVLCAERMDVEATGEIDNSVTLWSVEDFENTKVIKNSTTTTPISLKDKVKINNFQPFNFSGDDAPIHSNEVVVNIATMTQMEFHNAVIGNSSVKNIKYLPKNSPVGSEVQIYLINTDKLIINSSGINFDKVIIITNGDIEIKSGTSTDTLVTFNRSTIFGREFNFDLGSFFSSFRLIDNDAVGNDILVEEDIEEINKKIEQYIPLWGQNTSGGGISDTTIGDYEY